MNMSGGNRMGREEFLAELRRALSYLPPGEIEKSVSFYAECIDDRMEDGMTEEEAVAALGDFDEIIREIEAALPLSTIVRQRVQGRERSVWWVILAIIGFPVWLPLLLTAVILVVVVYLTIWIIIISLFIALLSLVIYGIGWLVYAVAKFALIQIFAGIMSIGIAAVSFGVAIVLEEPVKKLTKLLARLTGRFWRGLKRKILHRGVVA